MKSFNNLIEFNILLFSVFINISSLSKFHKNIQNLKINEDINSHSGINKKVEEHLRIPFAQAPAKHHRFSDPMPARLSISNPTGRQTFPPACPQNAFRLFENFKGMDIYKVYTKMEEDCLFLNIWKPIDGERPKPVIVWIHPGGFITGSSSVPMYNGTFLAAWSDSVVVSIQYRLGSFGYLYTGDNFAPGNAAIKDQVLALRWIRTNIRYFGGDRERITVVGDSAGSVTVGYHLLSPETSKLFKRAILLSGVPNSDWASISSTKAKERTQMFASIFGLSIADMKDYLADTDFKEILNGEINAISEDFFRLYFVPTIVPPLIPVHPVQMLREAKHLKNKEIIVSWVKDEGSVFVAMDLYFKRIFQNPTDTPYVSREDFIDLVSIIVGRNNKSLQEDLVTFYEIPGENSYLKSLVEIYTDLIMKCPINQFIDESRKHGAKVYHIEYNYRGKNNPWPEWMGVEHTSDLEAFFGVTLRESDALGPNVLLFENYLNYIKNFVKTGNPNILGDKTWEENRTFLFGDELKTVDDRKEICAKLKSLMPNYLSIAKRLEFNFIGILSLLIVINLT